MDTLLQDLRYAIRTLARSPGFTAVSVVTLGLGIGAATAGFSLLNWVLLRPVPSVRDPSRAGFVSFAARGDYGYMPQGVTPMQRDVMLRNATAVSGLAGMEGPMTANAAADKGAAKRVSVDPVTSDYFATVGSRTQLGRAFVAEDDAPPLGLRVAVISDRLWHNLFAADSDVLGHTIRVNGIPFTVIGVAGVGFLGPDNFHAIDIWVPGSTFSDILHFSAKQRPPELPYNRFVLRLRDGASFNQAEAQLQAGIRALALADTSRFSANVSATVLPGLGLEAQYGAKEIIDHQLALIIGLAGLVLLVTCANVANLLLFRRAQRRADVAVRLVLGASRGRLVRYALTESALVGVASGALGVLLALWVNGVFHHYRMLRFISMEGLRLDWRVLGFAVTAGVLAAVLAGIIPAFLGSRADLGGDLKASGPTQAGGAPLLRTGLAVLQVAVSLTLVAGTYLFARTLQRYAQVPLGFDPAGVTIFQVDPKAQGYSQEQEQSYLRALWSHIAALPGVEHVAFLSLPPFFGITNHDRVRRVDASPDGPPLVVAAQQISEEYFSVMRIPVLSGTIFQLRDLWPASGRVVGKVILSAALARSLYGAGDPVGQLVVFPGFGGDRRAEIVAIVGDVHWSNRGGDIQPMMYTPIGQDEAPYGPMLGVRSHIAAGTLAHEVEEIGKSLDPAMPIESHGPLSDNVAAATSSQTLLFRLVGLLSVFALVLSAVGVYSLIAYGVTTRTREFGIRMALGAQARDILRAAARPAAVIVVLGVVGGVAGTIYLTRFIKASLYGVSPLDPVAFVTAALLLGVAVLLASWIPARRATKVDPMVALRYE
jgi:putative ABC transport system permease protein